MHFMCVFVVTLAGAPSLALDMSGSKEQACFPTSSVAIDWNWLVKPKFYYSMMSRYYLYNVVATLLPEVAPNPEDIIEGSVYYDSCLRYQAYSGGCTITGYGGARERSYLYEPLNDSTGGIAFSTKDPPGLNGTLWISATDNSTYILAAYCESENVMSWKLMTTTPRLPSFLKNKILEKVVEMGFEEEYFTEVRYDTCKNQYDWISNGWSSSSTRSTLPQNSESTS